MNVKTFLSTCSAHQGGGGGGGWHLCLSLIFEILMMIVEGAEA